MKCQCGEILGNRQLVLEKKLNKLCQKYNMSLDMITRYADNTGYKEEAAKIYIDLFPSICCRQQALTYIKQETIIR